MLRRMLSLVLILCLLCMYMPATLAESMDGEIIDTPVGYTTLQRGDRDGDDSAAIVNLQLKLRELNYLRDSADGVYGKNTEKAVATFQRCNGLEETGIADPATQEKLLTGTDLVDFTQSDDPESVSFRVDKALNVWGFTGSVPDGRLNQLTEETLPAFKTYLNGGYLRRHPTPTPEILSTPAPNLSSGFGDAEIVIDTPMIKDDGETITPEILNFVDNVVEFEVYSETVSNGDEGPEVLRVQRRLYNLKYLAIANSKFDSNTERALLYFQKKNGLNQTGVADETTQRLLFSEAAVESEEFIGQYKYVIDVSDQRVYVYAWNGTDYGTCVREMICSTGLKSTPTPFGTFQAAGPTGTGEWYWFKEFECYAKWATRIIGGILFHSTTYSRGKVAYEGPIQSLGRPASHGCVRLKVEDALWTYEHCEPGTTVVVQV